MLEFTQEYYAEIGKVVVEFSFVEDGLKWMLKSLEGKGFVYRDELDETLGKDNVSSVKKKLAQAIDSKLATLDLTDDLTQEFERQYKDSFKVISEAIDERNNIIHSTWGWGPLDRNKPPIPDNVALWRERVLNCKPLGRQSVQADVQELRLVVEKVQEARKVVREFMSLFVSVMY